MNNYKQETMPSYRPYRIPENKWEDVANAYDSAKWSDLVFYFNYYGVGIENLCFCTAGENVARQALEPIYKKIRGDDNRRHDKEGGQTFKG